MSDHSDIGNRMKRYENVSRIYLTQRMPTILRIDGKNFHVYCRGFEKPWDLKIVNGMVAAAGELLKEIQGAKIAYCQSDEISILMNDYEKFTTTPWFDKNVQKMCSVSASIATAAFNKHMALDTKVAYFDSRCFVLPREEAVNYMHWRQLDSMRNSVSALAQKNFSHKQLHRKSVKIMKIMLNDIGIDWGKCLDFQKRGWCVLKTNKTVGGVTRTCIDADWNIPLFSKDRNYIGKYLEQKEE